MKENLTVFENFRVVSEFNTKTISEPKALNYNVIKAQALIKELDEIMRTVATSIARRDVL